MAHYRINRRNIDNITSHHIHCLVTLRVKDNEDLTIVTDAVGRGRQASFTNAMFKSLDKMKGLWPDNEICRKMDKLILSGEYLDFGIEAKKFNIDMKLSFNM